MTGHRRFPEGTADPLSAMPQRTPIIVEGHSASASHAVREVSLPDVGGATTGVDGETWVFRSSRTSSTSFAETFEHQASYAEPSSQTDQAGSEAKQKRDIPHTYIITFGAVAFLAAFYLLVYTPFIRVAWIESLEDLGQSAAFASQKCAILDMEDSIFRDGSLHPKLVRFGCTMVERGQRPDRSSQSKQLRPGVKPGRTIPDISANTHSQFGLWSFP